MVLQVTVVAQETLEWSDQPMKKNSARKAVDICIYFSMCFVTATGFLLYFRLPPGSEGGRGLHFLGLTRHQWGDWHMWVSCLLIAMILAHLFLNYAFIKNVVASRKKWLILL